MSFGVNFWTDFNEQGNVELLLIALVVAALYSAVILILVLASRPAPGVVRSLVWSAVALQLFAASLVVYQAGAMYYRRSPPGSDAERQGAAFDDWQLRARVGFIAIYLLALAVTAGGGYVVERRKGAVTATGAMAGFMLVTFVFVEYINTCEIGYGWTDFACT